MAGIFKSIDQSDIRVTPFRSHKLWTDTSVSYGYASNSISTSNITKLFSQTYNRSVNDNTFYALVSSSVDPNLSTLYRIDGGENSVSIGNKDKVSYAFGNLGVNLDKVIAVGIADIYLLNYDLTIDSQNSFPHTSMPVGFDACFDTGNGVAFIGTSEDPNCGGLYDFTNNQDYTAVDAKGDYWGTYYMSSIDRICTLFRSSSGDDIYLALYETNSPGTLDKGPYVMGPKPDALRTFFINESDPLAIDGYSVWALFDDDNVYVSSGALDENVLAFSGVAEILLDNDLVVGAYNQTQRVHVVTRSGRIYFDVIYDYYGNVLRVGSELDLASYIGIGMGNTVQKAVITRNNEWLNAGDAIISIVAGNMNNLNESLFLTVNTNTYAVSDPVHLGSVKASMHLVADTNTTYATDYTGSINIHASAFLNNWYTFTY